jgi:hypothetical protein
MPIRLELISPFFRVCGRAYSARIGQMEKPGQELIEKGITDLEGGRQTIESLLVELGGPRLNQLEIS